MGVPLGTHTYTSGIITQKGEEVRGFMHKVAQVPGTQIALLLLRYCANTRWHYMLRQVPHTHTAIEWNSMQNDRHIQECFQSIGGLPELTDWQLEKMELPITHGGFGLVSAYRIAPIAFFASAAECAHSILERKLVKGITQELLIAQPWAEAVTHAREAVEQLLPSNSSLHLHEVRDLFITSVHGLQKTLTHAIHKHMYTQHLASAASDRDKAVTRSSTGPGAAGLLSAIPFNHQLKLTNTQMKIFLRRRLCMTLPVYIAHGTVCKCGQYLDLFGDHVLCCKVGNERFVRHDALVRTFANILERAGEKPMKEQRLTQFGIPENKPGQRMDLVHLDKNPTQTFEDVSIRVETAPSYVHAAAHTDGWTIQFAQRAKNAKYKHKVNAAGGRFRALVAETEGRWGEGAVQLLREVAGQTAEVAENNSVFVRNRIMDRGWKELGCALQKFNAYLILSRTVAATLGNNVNTFAAGVPVGEGGLQAFFTPDWV